MTLHIFLEINHDILLRPINSKQKWKVNVVCRGVFSLGFNSKKRKCINCHYHASDDVWMNMSNIITLLTKLKSKTNRFIVNYHHTKIPRKTIFLTYNPACHTYKQPAKTWIKNLYLEQKHLPTKALLCCCWSIVLPGNSSLNHRKIWLQSQ